MRTLLEVEAVDGGYGQAQVLRSISLRLEPGEQVGLFGPNGHGKTTLLRTISGLQRLWKGEIRFGGTRITHLAPRKIVTLGLVHVPQGNVLFPRMTVYENLMLGAYSPRAWDNRVKNLERVYALFPRLQERKDQLCRTLSGGERQMVSIGMGLMSNPVLLMLDEPTLGLAPKVKDELRKAISEIAGSGLALIVVDQDVEFLLDLTSRLYLIEQGRVALKTGRGQEIDEGQILEMYFGRSRL
jgi:branched-chain amino acid transport system ATP-binding protein